MNDFYLYDLNEEGKRYTVCLWPNDTPERLEEMDDDDCLSSVMDFQFNTKDMALEFMLLLSADSLHRYKPLKWDEVIDPTRLSQCFAYLKKQALADGCEVPPSNVSRWLSGGDIPRKHYPKIAEVTGKSITYLCGVDDDN